MSNHILAGRAAELAGRPHLLTAIVLAALSAGDARALAGELQTVVTAPTPDREAREDVSASASVVTSDRTPRSAETLPQLVAELPGVHVTRVGGLGSLASLSIRGSTPNQVQVYVDGVPLNSAVGGGVDLGLVPIGELDRLELYRGQSPIGFGASGIGGVLALTSRLPDRTGATAELGGGSFGTRFGGGSASWVGQRTRAHAGVHYLASDGNFLYLNDGGTASELTDDRRLRRTNNAMEQLDATARVASDLPGRRLVVTTLTGLRREQGIPGVCCQDTSDAHLGFDRLTGQIAYVSRGDLGPGGRVEARAYGLLAQQRLRDLASEITGRPTHTRDQTAAYGTTVRGRVLAADWASVSAVIDGRYEAFAPFDQASRFPAGVPGTRASAAAGTEAALEVRVARLTVIPSARLEVARDSVSTRNAFTQEPIASPATTDLLPVLRLGLIQRPLEPLALRANVGRYRRLPSMFERYGNTGVVLPNPQLRPETAVNADAGLAWTFGDASQEARRLVLDAGVFASWAQDLIGLEVVERSKAIAVNVGSARITGLETSATGGWRVLRVFVQGTYTNARDAGEDPAYRGRALPLRPRLRGYARPELRFATRTGAVRFGVHADADYTAGYFADPTNLVQLPARLLVGAGGFVEESTSGLRATISAQNLGDVSAFDFVGYPLPGRSVFLTLAWSMPERKSTLP